MSQAGVAPVNEQDQIADPESGAMQGEPPEMIKERIEAIIQRLDKLAADQVSAKASIEKRWMDDLRLYHGRYDAATEKALIDANKSRLFIKDTRSKTHAWEARLSDLLFPTDDKNWSVAPTPVPELADQAEQATAMVDRSVNEANMAVAARDVQGAQSALATGDQYANIAAKAQAQIDEAAKRCAKMGKTIEDQLGECLYSIKSRDVIRDWVRLGTGIMKGPIVSHRTRGRWKAQTATDPTTGQATTSFAMGNHDDPRPDYLRVDPWNFFPDMSATKGQEAEFTFERHLWNKKELKKQAQVLKFYPEAVRELLTSGKPDTMPSYWSELQSIVGNDGSPKNERFLVWEFRGLLDNEDLASLSDALGNETITKAITDDPLIDMPVVIWFCQGKLLKFGPDLLDSGETLYSVVPFEEDDTSMFGFGVPYLMQDSQRSENGVWRMMHDNGGLSVGPQIVVNRKLITPANGDWNMTSRKVWTMNGENPNATVAGAFGVFHIESRQDQLSQILVFARQFADAEAEMPIIAQGDQASHVTQTKGGMGMLMNSANVVFRRVVKNFDDHITVPNIRRIYDFNMQFNPDESIKGDYEVDARGTSTLLVREIQGQNLMALAGVAANNPQIGMRVKWGELSGEIYRTHLLDPGKFLKTDQEVEAEMKAKAANGPTEDPRITAVKIDGQNRMELAQFERETRLMELAEKLNMTREDLAGMLKKESMTTSSKERMFAAEAATTQQPRNAA